MPNRFAIIPTQNTTIHYHYLPDLALGKVLYGSRGRRAVQGRSYSAAVRARKVVDERKTRKHVRACGDSVALRDNARYPQSRVNVILGGKRAAMRAWQHVDTVVSFFRGRRLTTAFYTVAVYS